jgi:WD40-like Beta Propeller Repeat
MGDNWRTKVEATVSRGPYLSVLWLLGALITGCGEDLTAPGKGAIEVTSVTAGGPADPDGYSLAVDGGAGQALGTNATLTVLDLPAGDHELTLGGMAPNCVLAGPNPRTVTVTSGATARTTFEAECSTPTGSIEITTTTTGESPDPDGYSAALDGAPAQPIGSNGTVTFAGVPAGDHTVGLTGVTPNCTVVGENPRAVAVGADAARSRFDITCRPPTGTIVISTTTTGPRPDPDGYAAKVDAGGGQAIASIGTLTVPNLPVGDHTIQLSGLASNCSLAGDNPRLVTVTNGGTTTSSFSVSCVPTGTGTILFASDRTGASHLYRAQEDGSNIVDLTPSRVAFEGDWSPDGSRIVFATHQSGSDRIALMDADGSNLVVLGVAGESPKWSPDGARVVLESDGIIRVMNADGGQVVVLVPGRRPDWSPDGTLIVFDRQDPTRCVFDICHEDLYVMSRTGEQVRKLVTDGACAAWSPDGTRIAYRFLFVGLFLVNADGSGMAQIAGAEAGCPVVWSPDGSAIAYASAAANGTSELTVIPASGGPGAVLVSSPASEFPESWK